MNFLTRIEQEKREREVLAPYAICSGDTRGRYYPEEEHEYRTCFQRDRDRIVHCEAFRRLEYKTQVFLAGSGDHYRTRLTHTLEVAQIARTLARALRVNEELCEAGALAHDLGHPPFGHAGERILNQLMPEGEIFEHNAQALRIVDRLEYRYPDFPGLNLTRETRRGILKDKKPYPGMGTDLPPDVSIESQIVDIADEISYTSHDLDDGIEAGFLREEEVLRVPLWRDACAAVLEHNPALEGKRKRYQLIIAVINAEVTDVLMATALRLEAQSGPPYTGVVGFSGDLRKKVDEARDFLSENLYQHPRVLRANSRCYRIIEALAGHYRLQPRQMPAAYQKRIETEGLARAVADYISGMTDRYAEEDHRQLFGC